MRQKALPLFRFAIAWMLVVSWALMMFLPAFTDTMFFWIWICIMAGCNLMYAVLREKYAFVPQTSKAEKWIAILMIGSLFVRLLFFR